jgi:hypothetical protein
MALVQRSHRLHQANTFSGLPPNGDLASQIGNGSCDVQTGTSCYRRAGNQAGEIVLTTCSVFRERCTRLAIRQSGRASVARERRLGAREVEEIFTAFAEAMRELPPDVEAGWLDAQGDLRLAPDIARKLRTARRVRQLLQELRQREREC